jgi:hypothetical protein
MKKHPAPCTMGLMSYLVSAIVYQFILCVTSVFGYRPRRMLRIIQRFGKHCSCHFQGDCVEVRRFWKRYIGQAVDGDLDSLVLIC